jgi:hypothetical protein
MCLAVIGGALVSSAHVAEWNERSSRDGGRFIPLVHSVRSDAFTLENMHHVICRFVQRAPAAFFQSPVCCTLFECGLAALTLDHQEANRSVTKFFTETIESRIEARKVRICSILCIHAIAGRGCE